MPTDQLIVHFYSDFLDHQQEQSKAAAEKYGELVVSAGFVKGSSAVEVNVIHGENMGKFYAHCVLVHFCDEIIIIPLEMVGEPYIKLRLSSVCQASDKHWKTKPVKGMQKTPIFNEDIKLYVVLV